MSFLTLNKEIKDENKRRDKDSIGFISSFDDFDCDYNLLSDLEEVNKMSILGYIGIIFLFLALVDVVIFLYDIYRHPLCSKCKNNLYSKRVKGKIICQVHREV